MEGELSRTESSSFSLLVSAVPSSASFVSGPAPAPAGAAVASSGVSPPFAASSAFSGTEVALPGVFVAAATIASAFEPTDTGQASSDWSLTHTQRGAVPYTTYASYPTPRRQNLCNPEQRSDQEGPAATLLLGASNGLRKPACIHKLTWRLLGMLYGFIVQEVREERGAGLQIIQLLVGELRGTEAANHKLSYAALVLGRQIEWSPLGEKCSKIAGEVVDVLQAQRLLCAARAEGLWRGLCVQRPGALRLGRTAALRCVRCCAIGQSSPRETVGLRLYDCHQTQDCHRTVEASLPQPPEPGSPPFKYGAGSIRFYPHRLHFGRRDVPVYAANHAAAWKTGALRKIYVSLGAQLLPAAESPPQCSRRSSMKVFTVLVVLAALLLAPASAFVRSAPRAPLGDRLRLQAKQVQRGFAHLGRGKQAWLTWTARA
eukprot:scaffold803_cov310-Pinguiococcus_pyrenoidosus.AAC.58